MSITSNEELLGMQQISNAVAETLKQMRGHAAPGMTAKELDDFGGAILNSLGAKSAPRLAYDFPGWTCISVNDEIAHGIPSPHKRLREGDLVNIDVSAELDGYWADTGASAPVGVVTPRLRNLLFVTRETQAAAMAQARAG